MLSPLIQQQDSFFFDILMSDPKALAALSDELCSCVTEPSPVPSTASMSYSDCCLQYGCTPCTDDRLHAANEAPDRADVDLTAFLPARPERPASSSTTESEASTSTTPTLGNGLWDHELLHPRVLGRDESAAFRRQRAARREQRRLAQQREAFEKLQEALPGNTSRMSRLDLLRLAIKHIQELNDALARDGDDGECDTASESDRSNHSD